MANTVRLVDGATEVVLRPALPGPGDAVFLSEFDLGFPDVREVKQDNAGADGVLDLTTRFGARTITAKIKLTGGGRNALADRLRAMAAPNRRPYLYIQRDGWEGERRTLLRPNPYSCVWTQKSAAYLEVALSWSAPSGLLEAADFVEVALYPPSSGTGMAFTPAAPGAAATLPAVGHKGLAFAPADPGDAAVPPDEGLVGLAFDPGSATNTATATNPGTAAVSPVIQIVGACTDPGLYNRTTNRAMVFAGLSIPAGHYVQIDVAARSVLMDSDSAQPFDSKINWAASNWLEIAPGDNELFFNASSVDTNCYCDVQFYPRWF